MKLPEIIEKLTQGKYVVWIDDKQNARLTPDYMEAHFVCFVDTIEEGYEFCSKKQEEERNQKGKATTRYRITGLKEDYVCSEDLSQEDMQRIVDRQEE